ncbi:MAG: GNAT family N-acetyltransferase [Streptomycetaceae bacterium]|nr:GNAT family N-acetyltransferase [Streptomycetaceae bacterium]
MSARSQYTVRDVARADAADYFDVLALADPDEPAPFAPSRHMLAAQGYPAFPQGEALAVIARDRAGNPAGALLAGTPAWLLHHPATSGDLALLTALGSRLSMVHGLAVHPDHNGHGLGGRLLRHAEHRLARAGFGMSTLIHPPHLERYYTRLGYTSAAQLLVNLPTGLAGQIFEGARAATKPLDPRVRLTHVPGAPAPIITGLLADTRIHPEASFADGVLHEPRTRT